MAPTPAPPAWAHRTTDATAEQLAAVDAWWRAANYLSIGQIYLQGNPLLRHRLSRDDIKPRLLGHWGTWGVTLLVDGRYQEGTTGRDVYESQEVH